MHLITGQRAEAILKWVSQAAIPVFVAVMGWVIVTSMEGSKLEAEYVRIAVEILSSADPDSEYTDEDLAMRAWAVRVLNEHSPVQMTQDEQAAFKARGVRLAQKDIEQLIDEWERKQAFNRLMDRIEPRTESRRDSPSIFD